MYPTCVMTWESPFHSFSIICTAFVLYKYTFQTFYRYLIDFEKDIQYKWSIRLFFPELNAILLYGELELGKLCKKWHRCVMNLTLKDQPLKPSIKDKVDLLCFNTTHYSSVLHLCVFHYLVVLKGKAFLFKIVSHLRSKIW